MPALTRFVCVLALGALVAACAIQPRTLTATSAPLAGEYQEEHKDQPAAPQGTLVPLFNMLLGF